MPEAPIELTDEAIEEAKAMIGVWSRRSWSSFEVTSDALRDCTFGIGDDNPLYYNDDYGKNSPWGSVIAPPYFLVTLSPLHFAPKLRGLHWHNGGTEWYWFKPIRPGDIISTKARLIGVEPKRGRVAGHVVVQTSELIYTNQYQEVVAIEYPRVVRAGRARANQGVRYAPRRQEWTPEDIMAIDDASAKECRRGSKVRYWEDVQIGEELPPMIRGPLRAADLTFNSAVSIDDGWWYSPRGAHIYQLEVSNKHPDSTYIDPKTGVAGRVHWTHWDQFMATEAGYPGITDLGSRRAALLATIVTDWMGDAGWIEHFIGLVRRPRVVSDVMTCTGTVVKKYVEDGRYLVDLELHATIQTGEEIISSGAATVRLPSRTSHQTTNKSIKAKKQ